MNTNRSRPPRWAGKMLSWFCKDEVVENVQGDLHELFHQRVQRLGLRKARLLYLYDMLSLVKPRLLRNVQRPDALVQNGMFRNYFKSSVRVLRRDALFSGINIVGLAISMSVGILMVVLLTELQSFDSFHDNKDRIYRVTTFKRALLQGESELYATTSHYLGGRIASEVAGVEQVLILDRKMSADFRFGDTVVPVAGYYASNTFFDVFSFKLKKGNPTRALENAGSVVLTESMAKKLFGDEDPMDKTILVEANEDFRLGLVTGIMEDPPVNSHIDFEVLVSTATVDNSLVERRRKSRDNPGNYAQSYVYVVLKEGARPADIDGALNEMMAIHNANSAPVTLSLQPLRDFVREETGYAPGPVFSQRKVTMMIALSVVVLLSACFNYSHLSLVKALRRCKEVSVRKINGAARLHIFGLFMTESFVVSFMALIAGLGLFLLVKPQFLALPDLTHNGSPMFQLDLTVVHTAYLLMLAAVVGFLAGFFPSLILSKLKAHTLVYDAGRIKVFSGLSTQHVLTAVQMTLSISLIMCAVILFKQYKFVLNYDLGFETREVLNVRADPEHADALENAFATIAGVEATSRSAVSLGTRHLMPADATTESPADTLMFSANYIDDKYLSMHGFELLAGTGFLNPANQGTSDGIIVNTEFLKSLSLGSPEQALGKQIWYFGERKLTIQGVVADFVSHSLDAEAPAAFGFLLGDPHDMGILGVKISGNNRLATLQALERAYKQVDPVHPFEAAFYDDQIATTYAESKATYKIISYLAFLAISISALGMLGTAAFTVEARMKEISIRKVLGAGGKSLFYLLSKNVFLLILAAGVIAVPSTLLVVDQVMLSHFIYRVDPGIIETLSGMMVVLFIGGLTTAWQIRAAGLRNPAEVLRKE